MQQSAATGSRRLTVAKEVDDEQLKKLQQTKPAEDANNDDSDDDDGLTEDRPLRLQEGWYAIASNEPGDKYRQLKEKSEKNRFVEAPDDKWKPACAANCFKGKKPSAPNQDSFCVIFTPAYSIYGVFDGHGPNGHFISEAARNKLMNHFTKQAEDKPPESDDDIFDMLKASFKHAQDYIENNSKSGTNPKGTLPDANTSGTTCTIAYHDHKMRKLYLAWVGDSRVVVWNDKTIVFASTDHKPEIPSEKQRIESQGGRVIFDGYFNYRVFSTKGMYPGLNMSRALGDLIAQKEAGLTAEPELQTVEVDVTAGLKMLVCSDGVWEFIENEMARKLILELEAGDNHKACTALAEESYDRWMKDSDGEISDDITAILVDLSKDNLYS